MIVQLALLNGLKAACVPADHSEVGPSTLITRHYYCLRRHGGEGGDRVMIPKQDRPP